MENIEKSYFQYDLQTNGIINKFLSQVKSISETMALFYHAALNYYTDPIPGLQTDSLPITIADTNNIKEMAAYKFVRILGLAKSTEVFQVTELEQVQEQLQRKLW